MLKNLIDNAVALYRRYPSRINSYITAGIVTLAGAVGLVIDTQSALAIVAIAIPILLGGEATHRRVRPTR